MKIWISPSDVMAIAKIYNLTYPEAQAKVTELVAENGNEAEFV